ncbi:fungal-specific transcription factor domain-domain-containing protein [Coniella lustricola]|uniref:Fungal-specific transcription factor domain-domain-containing protein n=1 Tax=Coniella lustricola TaxID=2025994 RepID=A0A2T3A259_9PEZI|nr:fungal-specific transcription factor domain-domain-containing protein [Coniella lustricola]
MASSNITANKAIAKHSRQAPGPACQQCRQRKFRCDRSRPCSGCVDSGFTCDYETNPIERGPKKGHLKAMRSRIAALERRLDKEKQSNSPQPDPSNQAPQVDSDESVGEEDWDSVITVTAPPPSLLTSHPNNALEAPAIAHCPQSVSGPEKSVSDFHISDVDAILELHLTGPPITGPGHWLSSNDPDPSSNLILPLLVRADLDGLYFDRIHLFMPAIQRKQYYRRSRAGPGTSESHSCLQYCMWTLAAAVSSQFHHLRDALYHQAIKMLGQTHNPSISVQNATADETTSQLELVQAWILISIYEFTQVTFKKAWSSAGQAIRLVQLLRLSNVDAQWPHVDANATSESDAFVLLEEQRRTFWMAFCLDRLSSILEELPLTLGERSICTRLPCPEQAFQSGTPVSMPFLSQALVAESVDLEKPKLFSSPELASPFVESILFTALWGRVFDHQQQCAAEVVHGALSSNNFRERQLQLEALLSSRMAQFQHTFSTPAVEVDQMLLFTSMIAQMTTMALCKAAEMAPQDATEYSDILLSGYQWRAPAAAKEIAHLIELLEGFNLFKIHPFTPVPLYLSRKLMVALEHDDTLKDSLSKINDILDKIGSVNKLCQENKQSRVDMSPSEDIGFPNYLAPADAMGPLYSGDVNMIEIAKL